MIVEILVAQRQAVDPLPHQFRDAVLGPGGVAVVPEAAGELSQDAGPLLGLVQQQSTGLGGDCSSVKVCHYRARRISGESEVGSSTLCHSEKPFLSGWNIMS